MARARARVRASDVRESRDIPESIAQREREESDGTTFDRGMRGEGSIGSENPPRDGKGIARPVRAGRSDLHDLR